METLLAPATDDAETDSVALLGCALHRMRNMMMSVRGYAELIAEGEADHAMHRRWARRIVEQLDRLESMQTRIDGTQARSQSWGLHSLALVVRAATERCRQRHGASIEVTLDLEGDVLLEAQGEALREAIGALIDNAIEATADAGRRTPVSVTLASDFESWSLEIEDHGNGLDRAAVDALGRPFSTRKPGHLGLGLYVSRTLFARHGLSLDLGNATHGGTVATIRGRKFPSGGER